MHVFVWSTVLECSAIGAACRTCVNLKPHSGAAVARLPAAVCQMQDMIKGATALTGWNLESHTRGMEALRCYTSSGDCRHASLVNFFQPGALDTQGPCEGGCDNCTRRCADRGCRMAVVRAAVVREAELLSFMLPQARAAVANTFGQTHSTPATVCRDSNSTSVQSTASQLAL